MSRWPGSVRLLRDGIAQAEWRACQAARPAADPKAARSPIAPSLPSLRAMTRSLFLDPAGSRRFGLGGSRLGLLDASNQETSNHASFLGRTSSAQLASGKGGGKATGHKSTFTFTMGGGSQHAEGAGELPPSQTDSAEVRGNATRPKSRPWLRISSASQLRCRRLEQQAIRGAGSPITYP